ncbi:GNAT family N-acetyltransferase [Neglectibacter caecimuris]|uniref:GNAT family N-acetyltransferase n=1 Tax=Neglectibacter caecimuris TaxID=3093658 RepID=UPI002AC8C5DD|nr:GNAT family N-acetyltransferase [Neglectibacter sp. M00184]
MLSLVEQEKEQKQLLRLCEKTPFGCKIAGIALAYGFDKGFSCFWVDTESDTVFCQSDGLMVISGTVLHVEETKEFLRAVGPQAILCAVRNAEALSLPVSDSGDVLKKQTKPGEEAFFDPYVVNIREIFGLLEETGMLEEFEPFYLDLSHKLRHKAALVLTEYSGSELSGCALVSSISKEAAVLSALAVAPGFRRQGIGSGLVRRVESCFPGKTLYVFREKEKNQEFYKKLGYVKTDTWVYSQK